MKNHEFVDGMRVVCKSSVSRFYNKTGSLFISDKKDLGRYKFESEDGSVLYCGVVAIFQSVENINHYKEIKELRAINSRLDEISFELFEDKEVDGEVVERLDEAIRNIRKAIISLKTK